MNCPICQIDLVSFAEHCPSCYADLSVATIMSKTKEELLVEAENELKDNFYAKNARAKMEAVRLLDGNVEKLDELIKKGPTVGQIISYIWVHFLLRGVVLVLGLTITGLTGTVISQYHQIARNTPNPPLVVSSPSNNAIGASEEIVAAGQHIQESTDVYLIVRKGDSLWKISKDLNKPGQFISKLAEENAMGIDDLLYPGQRLKIPVE
jgi:LysM repeat protein